MQKINDMDCSILNKKIPFVQAASSVYKQVPVGRSIQIIVIHSMEAPEKGYTAEAVANYFKNGSGGRYASAHYNIDNDSIVQSVQTRDIAYGAKGVNSIGIHLEHAGYARQTRAEWLDPYSRKMLENSACLCAQVLMPKFNIPARWLTASDLKRARWDKSIKGITSHAEASRAFNPGGHTDPGKGFPIDIYLQMIINRL